MSTNGRTQIVILGGGFGGVYTAMHLEKLLAHEPDVDIVLVHPGEAILPELGPKLGAYAQKKLAQRGVDIRTNTRVTGVTEHEVTLSDGSTIPSSTVVWTAGTSPNPLLAALPCTKERGRVVVNEYKDLVQFITLRAPTVSHVDHGEHPSHM